jgi:hypothetical protein
MTGFFYAEKSESRNVISDSADYICAFYVDCIAAVFSVRKAGQRVSISAGQQVSGQFASRD